MKWLDAPLSGVIVEFDFVHCARCSDEGVVDVLSSCRYCYCRTRNSFRQICCCCRHVAIFRRCCKTGSNSRVELSWCSSCFITFRLTLPIPLTVPVVPVVAAVQLPLLTATLRVIIYSRRVPGKLHHGALVSFTQFSRL